jgi:hypothetical protein
MEVGVPWGGGNSNTAPFAAFGGSIREICCPVFAAFWPIWGKIMAKK